MRTGGKTSGFPHYIQDQPIAVDKTVKLVSFFLPKTPSLY
jgi:hypothetical protein